MATDGWSGYAGLAAAGYAHEPLNLSASWGDAALRLPAIHLVFGLAKRWLLGTHHGAVSAKHLPAYLDEFVFRFNRRTAKSISHRFARIQPIVADDLWNTQFRTTDGREGIAHCLKEIVRAAREWEAGGLPFTAAWTTEPADLCQTFLQILEREGFATATKLGENLVLVSRAISGQTGKRDSGGAFRFTRSGS